MPNPYEPPSRPEPTDASSTLRATPTRRTLLTESQKAVIILGVVAAGIIAAIAGLIYWIVGLNTEDHEAAVALNQHISRSDVPARSTYLGTEPMGGRGAVAIRTNLGEDAGSKQSAGAMCAALIKTKGDVPSVKKVSIRSSTGYPIWSCW